MRSFTLTIDCSYAAFDEGLLGPEIARIMSGVAFFLRHEALSDKDYSEVFFDINGNRVGSWHLRGES